jgi:hypothetical protein
MYPASFEYFAGAGTLVDEGATFPFRCDNCRGRFEADLARFVAAGTP